MHKTDTQLWLREVHKKTPAFLDTCIATHSGFVRFTPRHDLFPSWIHWGLNTVVYALKTIHTLRQRNAYASEIEAMCRYILSFERQNGMFTDHFLDFVAYPYRRVVVLRSGESYAIRREEIYRAQTRQALSVLRLYNKQPVHTIDPFAYIGAYDAKTFMQQLDWTHPWHAGSHVSHLFFFLSQTSDDTCRKYSTMLLEELEKRQDRETGAWFSGKPSTQEIINGIMKVLTGFQTIGYQDFSYKKQLVDTALAAAGQQHACDHFNIVYVLSRLLILTKESYRSDEMRMLLQKNLEAYRRFYYPASGGFSFYQDRSSIGYYGAIVARPHKGPDIHGTTMFLWGIALIVHALALPEASLYRPFTS